MKITVTNKEFNELDLDKLPDRTFILIQNSRGKSLRNGIVKDGKFKVKNDFVEYDRKWRKGEKEKFIKDKTREDVIKFWVNLPMDDNVTPFRKWKAMDELTHQLCKFTKHYGYENSGKIYSVTNSVQIFIRKKDNLEEVKNEILEWLNAIKKKYPNKSEIYIDIMEHTLSEFGSYSITWHVSKDKFSINGPYNHKALEEKSLNTVLKYVQQNHWAIDYGLPEEDEE